MSTVLDNLGIIVGVAGLWVYLVHKYIMIKQINELASLANRGGVK